jgi:cell division protein FtsB
MPSGAPQDSPTTTRVDLIESATREMELRGAVRREDLWLKANTTLLALLFGIVAFFGRDLYSDVKGHTGEIGTLTAQLATLTERVNDIKEKVDKIAIDTEQNGRSLAEIKGYLQAMPHPSSKDGGSDSSRR